MKLNNLSRLTALLLALTIFLSSVAFAAPVADTEWDSTSYQTMLSAVAEDCLCVTYYASVLPLDKMNGHTCVYEFLSTLGTTDQYQFLADLDNGQYQYLVDEETNTYSSYSVSDFLGAYYAHIDGTNGTKLDPLMCTCTDNLNGTYFNYEPGNGEHNEGCPWTEATETSTVIIPDIPQPPVYGGDPQGNQYTSNEEYDLPMANDRAIILPEGGRAVIHSNVEAADGYQWQVYDGTQWVSIQGETSADLVVTTAKLNTIFDLTGVAELRYFDVANDIVKASVSVTSQELAGGEYVDPVEEAQTLSLIERAEGDDTTTGPYTITVYYYYEGTQTPVYQASSATFPADKDINWKVTFPTVVGYEPYFADETTTSTEHTFTGKLTENQSYVVSYKPADVGFKVLHYQQNLADDKYTLFETVEYHPGLTNQAVPATGLEKEYEGFLQLPYSTTGLVIAADGSTVVEIYYDRNYCLMNFELNGGYGVEPIYAKYGSDTSNVGTPQRAGYSFLGWAATADDAEAGTWDATLPPATMPAGHVTYYAVWQKNATATVTIVHWGENADDEGYSYLEDPSTTVTLPSDSEYIYGGATLTCTQEAHEHDESCKKTCTEEEHSHTEKCYTLICTQEEHTHTHGNTCITISGAVISTEGTTNPGNNLTESNNDSGVYRTGNDKNRRYWVKNGDYYYQITSGVNNNNWQNVTVTYCDKTAHTHTAYTGSCYSLTCTTTLHTHGPSCYSCGKIEHTHNADCFDNDPTYPVAADSPLYTFVRSDVVTVNPDGSTVVNVYWDRVEFTFVYRVNGAEVHRFSEKWGKNILERWTFTGSNNVTYSPANKDSWTGDPGYTARLYMLQIMPQKNVTWTRANGGSQSNTFYYYVEALDNVAGNNRELYKNTYYEYSFEMKNDFNILDYEADFFELEGFERLQSAVKNGTGWTDRSLQTNTSPVDNLYFFYTRHRYNLEFHNLKTPVTESNIPYEKPLGEYDFTPTADQAPSHYEPGSVQFAGWYLNPDCTGEEFVLSEHTMPVGTENGETTLVLYAKWVPVTYTVNFYLTDAKYSEGLSGIYTPKQTTDADGNAQVWGPASFTVQHGDYIAQQYVEANLDYTAMNAAKPNGNLIFVYWKYYDEEAKAWKAFNPTSPVRKNLDLIGVWSSNTLVTYTVNFVYKDGATETVIADAINGSAMATTTKTFDAKGGTALYDGYQTGYFPVVPSHSITMDLDETKNVFTFEYVKADNVPYKVFYLAETLKDGGTSLGTKDVTHVRDDGTTYVKTYYMIADTDEVDNNTKSVVTVPYQHVDGYLPDAYQKSLVLSVNADGTPNDAANEIYFFYTVNEKSTSYEVYHYIENPKGTETNDKDTTVKWSLYTGIPNNPETKPGEIDTPVAEAPQSIPYYKYDASISTAEGTPTEGAKLELKLYYRETTATINYVPVGPDGVQWDGTGTAYVTGTTDKTSETVKRVTGTAVGATATPVTNEYKFVGWYDNAACEGDPISTNAVFIPTKTTEQVWPDSTTYYAKFVVDKAVLTIKKTGMTDGEVAVFNVSGPGYNGKVIVPNGTTGLTLYVTCGEYTITEVDAWSWRYTLKEVKVDGTSYTIMPEEITLDADGTTIEVVNNRTNDQWLSDEATKVNKFNGEP